MRKYKSHVLQSNVLSLRNTKEPIEETVLKLLNDGTSPDVDIELADILSR